MLFTSIPIDDAIIVIRSYLEEDHTLPERTPFEIEQFWNFLLFASIPPILFTMETSINKHTAQPWDLFGGFRKKSYPKCPTSLWLKYVDNTLIKIQEEYIPEFTDHIKNIDKNIQFTNEPEVDGVIPFLDVKIRTPPLLLRLVGEMSTNLQKTWCHSISQTVEHHQTSTSEPQIQTRQVKKKWCNLLNHL